MPCPARLPFARALAALLLALPLAAAQGVPAEELLPGHEGPHDVAVPRPEAVLGWEPGSWHVEPEALVAYMEALAAASDRVSTWTYARSHEGKRLVLAAITSPANQARLEELRAAHVRAVREGTPPADGDPLVVWLGYSVHGNEPSGSNAAPTVAWHLASSSDPDVEALLERTIVLVDPTINPDGLDRFATWVNMHKGRQVVASGATREHREAWPGGRTNHYWFDLNRDWLLLAHPESQGRIEQYHRWLPNVLTDHHEMGTGSSFFFQPGVPSRRNPNTPEGNHALTRAIAEHHAAALDAIGQMYYSEERFDDFYYGKGSTYPDVNGSVGILFEQASSRGHLQEGLWGELPFAETIRNQAVTSLSTLAGADALRHELMEWQRTFGQVAMDEAREGDVAGWVFGLPHDPARVQHMLDVLHAHQIEVHPLGADVEQDGRSFRAGEAWLVPAVQRQARLARALFERRFEFEDPVFYDVSAWTLPLAHDVHDVALPMGTDLGPLRGDALAGRGGSIGQLPETAGMGWLIPWDQYRAPREVASLLREGVQLAVVARPFLVEGENGPREWPAGTVFVPAGRQDLERSRVERLLRLAEVTGGFDIGVAKSGFTDRGPDLGSPHVHRVRDVKPVILIGSGTSSYRAGELWHLLDHQWGLHTALVEGDALSDALLDETTHVVLAGGVPSSLGSSGFERLSSWVRAGGTVVAVGLGAAGWAERELLGLGDDDGYDPLPADPEAPGPESDDAEVEVEQDSDPRRLPYADYETLRADTLVGGAIYGVELDLTHPLAFGFHDPWLPVFRQGSGVMRRTSDPFAQAGVYADEPLLAGFSSDWNARRIGDTPAVTAQRVGGGCVIRIADAPWFRGAWPGSARLMANALFQSVAIERTGAIRQAGERGADAGVDAFEDEH